MAALASIFTSSTQPFSAAIRSVRDNSFMGASLPRNFPRKKSLVKISGKVRATATVTKSPMEEIKEHTLPSWAMFELGKAPVYWKTMNGLPPTSGEKLKLFYNPAASKLVPNEEFGIAFNGGFNQPIMCEGEPRAMLKKARGKADSLIYTIQICIPKHAVNLIFSFTNGVDWDGPYRLQFQVPKAWQNRPIKFFNQKNFFEFAGMELGRVELESEVGRLADELSKEGACDKAIFLDTNIVVDRCAMIGNLSKEGGDRCRLDLVPGCMDPNSHLYNPLANIDDGSCLIDSDVED